MMIRNDEYSAFYRKYFRIVGSYVYQRVSNYHDAEDLVSITFFKALKNFDKCVADERGTVSWLYTIAGNTVRDYYKHKSHLIEIDIDDLVEISDDTANDFIENIDDFSVYKTVRDAVCDLPSDKRELVFLRYFCDMSVKDISVRTGRCTSAVRKLLQRSLKQVEDYVRKKGVV